MSHVLRGLSRSTSVTKLIINTKSVRFASVAFQELFYRLLTVGVPDIAPGVPKGYSPEEVDRALDERHSWNWPWSCRLTASRRRLELCRILR
jgi:hypothetical protein